MTNDAVMTTPVRRTRSRPSMSVRRRLCLVTVVACVPYVTLKLLWIAGVGVGVAGSTFLDDARGANIATACLDLCAAGLAILLVHPVGRRVPAWLVAVPGWVATGLLAPLMAGIVIGLPVQFLGGARSGAGDDGGLHGWVFVVVYSGFVVQGALVAAALVLYAADRWPALFARRCALPARTDAASGTRRILESAFVVGALVMAVLTAHGAVAGGGIYPDPSVAQRCSQAGYSVLAVAGAVAYLRFRSGRPVGRTTMLAGWLGSGVVFTESLVFVTDLVAPDQSLYGPGAALLCVLALLCGLAGAVAGMLRLEALTTT